MLNNWLKHFHILNTTSHHMYDPALYSATHKTSKGAQKRHYNKCSLKYLFIYKMGYKLILKMNIQHNLHTITKHPL